MTGELTVQRLDPLTVLALRPLVIAAVLGADGFAILATAQQVHPPTYPELTGLALLALFAASAVVVVATQPVHRPVGARVHAAVHLLGAGALALSLLGHLGANEYARNDWGPVTLALLIAALAPYRPPRELGIAATLTSIGIGAAAFLTHDASGNPMPASAYLLIEAVPVLAAGWAAAAFAHAHIHGLLDWGDRAWRAVLALESQWRDGLARSVQQDRVTLLNRDVLPFLISLLERGEITDDDAEQARGIAQRTRALLLATVDRSWLEVVVEECSGGLASPASLVRGDPHLADHAGPAQRIALRAMLSAVLANRGSDVTAVSLTLDSEEEDRVVAELVVPSREGTQLCDELLAYLAVLAAAFDDVEAGTTASGLTLRFSYAKQRP